MEKLKQWIALTLVGALGIMAVGWFLLVSPKRSEAADLRSQTASQLSANALLETQIEVLKAQATELPKEQATLADIAAKIPTGPELPTLVRALSDAAATANVQLVSITPGTPVPVVPVAPAAAPANGETAPQPAAPATAPAAGPAGQLANVPISVSIVGDYFEVAAFVAALETLPRSFRVNDLTLTPGVSPTATDEDPAAGSDGSSLTTTVNGFVFMAAGVTPAAPAPATAADPAAAAAPSAAND
jgi:Tfp pilus assembly protein PilO